MIDTGEGTTVVISNTPGFMLEKVQIKAGRNCRITLDGMLANNTGLSINMGDDCELHIGHGAAMNGLVSIVMLEPSRMSIGAGCLFAKCDIWTTDMHPIYELASQARVNPAADVHIGNNVWIGHEALITKGSRVLDGCVISARSLINHRVPQEAHSVLAGTPATVKKSGIHWKFFFNEAP